MMSLADLLSDATTRLRRAGVVSPEVDAEWLMAFVLGLGRGEMLAKSVAGSVVESEDAARFEALVVRRERREPLQHLTGQAAFMGFEVTVGQGVFVPRPETEALAEWAVVELSARQPGDEGLVVLDLCAGSGVLAIALQRAVPYASVTAVELSDDALPYLERNVENLAPGVTVVQGSVAEATAWISARSVDFIVSNPPYVPQSEVPNDPEVADWDPAQALFGGVDGLDVVREIVQLAVSALKPGGVLALEHSNLQGDSVRELYASAGLRAIHTERDLTGRDRFTVGFQP